LALSLHVRVGTIPTEQVAHSESLLASAGSTMLSLSVNLVLTLLETLTSVSTNHRIWCW